MQEGIDIKQVKGIIRRRRKSFFLTFIPLFLLGIAVALILPSSFLSKATILIEGQQIPQEYVRTTITSFVEERLQVITQRIMSRTRLVEIIKRFGLYPEMKERYTTEEIIDKMREDIKFKTISADVRDQKTGQASVATIAFTLSYEGKNPGTVQKVANVLTSLYLEENLKTREQRASNTTDFLQQELDQLRTRMDSLQNRISEFKRIHIGQLPEHMSINLGTVERLLRDVEQVRMQANALKERKILLEGQIATVEPHTSLMTADGKVATDPSERLKFLKLQLLTVQSAHSERHPDVKRLKNEIQELEKQVGESGAAEEKRKRREELSARLAEMKGRLGPKHPDVVKMTRELDLLGEERSPFPEGEWSSAASEETNRSGPEGGKKGGSLTAGRRPDNPAYINLRTQIETTDLEIAALMEHDKETRKEISRYEKKIENAPIVEKEYLSLIRDHENARLKYNELTSKYLEAKVALGMEETQRGERFTIIDPAQLPEKPHSPNRLAIVLISFVLSLGAGVGCSALKEVADSSIKSADELNRLTGVPVLSVVSVMVTPEEKRARRVRLAAATLGAVGLIVVGLVVVDHFVMPLDVLLAKVQRKVDKVSTL